MAGRAFRRQIPRRGLTAALLALGLALAAPATAQTAAAQTAAAQTAPGQTAPGQADAALPSVTVVPAAEMEFVARVPVSGTLVARNEVLVYPQVSGYAIDAINVEAGDRVEKGAVLATLDDSTLAAQLAQARAEKLRAEASVRQAQSQIASARATLTQAESALERSESLRASGNISQSTLDQNIAAAETARAGYASAQDGLAVAEAQVSQAAAALDLAQLNLDRTRITAPVAGLVATRNARIGAIAASAGDPAFTLIAEGLIEVEAEVIETSLGLITPGDPVELAIAGIGPAEGEVRLIAPTVDPLTRLGRIRISILGQQGLRTGLFASGWIVTERRQAVAVPAAAVLSDRDGTYVLTVRDGVIERRAVEAGLIWQDRREIARGLAAGEAVVARAGAFFRDGDRVNSVGPGPVAEARR
jgi:RND family efflux transporter MFP subunit